MSAPYRHPHYAQAGASSSRHHNQRKPHRQWTRDQHSHPQNAYPEYSAGYAAYDAYHDAYAGDYRAYPQSAYYDAYPNDYHRADYGAPQAYGGAWHDGYGGGYAQPRYEGAWAAYDAQGYPPYAAHYAEGCAAPSDPSWRVDAPKSVQGAPAAPKKMREAAAAHASNGTDYVPYNNHAAHFQQQRDYHSGPASRYQPYSRTPSAPGTPTHPSTYRPPTTLRQPPAIRAAPRPEYIAQAKNESRRLSEDEARDRKLLVVLDLNGTLVFRGKGKNGRAVDSVRAVPRPYLLCFLQYCLGLSPNSTSASASAADEGEKGQGKVVDTETKPHGAHFWPTHEMGRVVEPRSAGKAEVVVWSSAQPFNVDSMVRASFDPSVRSQFLRVWARDTLVPARFFQHKAESVKDLEIVWAELNAFAHNRPSPGRLLAEARDEQDQLRPDDAPVSAPTAPSGPKKYKGKHSKQRAKEEKAKAKPVSAALEAARTAQELGPWGVENTVLVDDSVAKARLQPWNQLLIPEFDKVEAGRMKKFIRQQLPRVTEEGEGEEAELEYDSDLSIANEAPPTPATTSTSAAIATGEAEAEADAKMEVDEPSIAAEGSDEGEGKKEGGEKKSSLKKPIPESRLDDVLLQTIGVLETLRFQSNVSAFIQAGGITGYGQEKARLNEQQRQAKIEAGNTPEYWAEQGRQTCQKLGIEVKAWIPGAAASATAALL